MRLPVLIECLPGNGYRAKGGEPLALSAEAPTRDEAVACLKRLIADRLSHGAELISLDVGSRQRPPVAVPGWSEDDPLLDEWHDAMGEYRRQVEADPIR
jgi:hypothetical protein